MRIFSRSIVCLMALAFAGCSGAAVQRPAAGALLGSEPEEQMEFWHTLAESKLVSNDEAFHAVLLAMEGSDAAGDYAARVVAMKERGLLDDGFDEPADRAVTRGTLARAFAEALDIKGGVVMRIVGPHPRYALREMIHLALFPPNSSTGQTLSGRDFSAIIGRIDDYQQAIPVEPGYDPAGDEPLHVAHRGRRPAITPTPTLLARTDRSVGPALALADVPQRIVTDSPRLAFFQDNDADPADAPGVQAEDGQALAIEITEVKGAVQQRPAEDQPWQPAQVGQQLGTGTELRTGVRSSVTFRVDPGRLITLDRLGVTRVLAAIEQGGQTKVNLGTKYGRGRIVVEKGGREHETTVATPSMTLAVRGTIVDYYNQGWTHAVRGADGVVRYFNSLTRQTIEFAGPGDEATMKEGYLGPAYFARANSQQTPGNQKQSQEDWLIDQDQQASAGTFFRDLGIDASQEHAGQVHEQKHTSEPPSGGPREPPTGPPTEPPTEPPPGQFTEPLA